MDYINVEEAASEWGISVRLVQRLCAQDRVPHAARLGRSWIIPRDAKKPDDLRLHNKSQETSEDDIEDRQPKTIDWNAFAESSFFPDVTLLDDESSISLLMNKLYLQGDYERALEYYYNIQDDVVAVIALSYYAIAAALSCGDYDAYDEIMIKLKRLEHVYSGDNATKKVIELCLSVAPIGAYVTNLVPAWICEGDYSDLPAAFLSTAMFLRAKYLLATGQCRQALGIAETAISYETLTQVISVHNINLRLACATAYIWLGLSDKSLYWITETVDLCLCRGIIAPLSGTLADYGGMMEGYVKKQYPEQYDFLMTQSEYTIMNWTMFHNLVSETHLTNLLTLREIRIARRAAAKAPYSLIARDAGISVGSVKNTMQTIYSKLNINNRDELKQFVIPENMNL